MKKLIFLTIVVIFALGVKAQDINRDTLAKYSRKEEQLDVFNRIADDIQLNNEQRGKFNVVSGLYAAKAIAILSVKTTGNYEKLKALKVIGEEYWMRLGTFLTEGQLGLMKQERARYHFGKRFLVMADMSHANKS